MHIANRVAEHGSWEELPSMHEAILNKHLYGQGQSMRSTVLCIEGLHAKGL